MKYVESITVYPSNKTIQIGTWYYGVTATVCPYDADKTSVCWYSDNESVAAVNPTTGYIYGISLGTARIYARACDGSGVEGYMTVTVNSTVPVESVRFNYSKLSIAKGHSASLTAIVCPDNATNPSLNWSSNNEGVATIANGTISAISEGTAIITATAKDGSGQSTICNVTVTNGILVSSITVNPSEKTMTVDGSAFLIATVYPSNATKKSVYWRSDNSNIVTVNENSGLIVAQNPGTATVYAIACDGGGAQGHCRVTVQEPIKVECVCVYPQKMTIAPGEEEYIIANISPIWATNTSVTWKSSNPNVATVEKRTPANNGTGNLAVVIGKSKGTATITATSTDGSNKKSSCTVTVDPREKVTVKKDSHSFYVKFADGKVWKNIGIDLSNREENYNQSNPPNMSYENYPDLIEEEQRYFDNIYVEETGVMEYKTYSVKQIAYLYLLDPLGIEYYMRNHACHDKDIMSGELLSFKDEVYEAIFGNSERSSGRFYFTVSDGQPQYGRYSGYNRTDVYSNAEVLFGFHTIINWDLGEFIKSVLQGLFEWAMEDSVVGKGIQAYQILFHAGGILGACSDQASSYVTNYINEGIEDDIKEKFGEKVLKTCHWALTLVYILADSALSAFSLPNPQDITIYDKIYAVPDFLTTVDGIDGEWSIKDIIDKVNQN